MAGRTDREFVAKFEALFAGRKDAFGRGKGLIERQPLTISEYAEHLAGEGSGLGVFPLRDDGTVRFAAIDLDEPNFGLARELQDFLPGQTWIEKSRSGNAHVWAFFDGDVEGWIPRGIMKSALEAMGRKNVEVFPKQDRLRPGMIGNYINLPYHGDDRPILDVYESVEGHLQPLLHPHEFLNAAFDGRNDPADWRRRSQVLGIVSPQAKPDMSEFGDRTLVHPCAIYIYEHRFDNPIREGNRAKVLFTLAKQLLNWKAITAERALEMMLDVNAAGDPPAPDREVRRIWQSVIDGQYRSTGCDDPLVRDYVRPDCPIRNGALSD